MNLLPDVPDQQIRSMNIPVPLEQRVKKMSHQASKRRSCLGI
jgi:hypothetical protein